VWKPFLLVALGGALGAAARYGTGLALPRDPFPYATLAVNLIGAFLLGWLILGQQAEGTAKFLLGIGFLGAFTTLSTYGVETVALWQDGKQSLAALNVAANGLGGPAFALLGAFLR
jgi:CrcB protein